MSLRLIKTGTMNLQSPAKHAKVAPVMSLWRRDTSACECQQANRLLAGVAEALWNEYAGMRAVGLNPRLRFEGTKPVWKPDNESDAPEL
jgi:hypothetical protein